MAGQMQRLFTFLHQFLPFGVDLPTRRETLEDIVAQTASYERIDIDVGIIARKIIGETSQGDGDQWTFSAVDGAASVARRDTVIGRMASRRGLGPRSATGWSLTLLLLSQKLL